MHFSTPWEAISTDIPILRNTLHINHIKVKVNYINILIIRKLKNNILWHKFGI
jgi:hypothetical protein